MFTTRRTVADEVSIWTGRAAPSRTGPTVTPLPPVTFRTLNQIFAGMIPFMLLPVAALVSALGIVIAPSSSGDRVLALSRGINKSQRAGLHDGTPLTHDGLETVDVSDGVGAGGWLQVGRRRSPRVAAAWDGGRACAGLRAPAASRTRPDRCAPQPSVWPRSWAMERT